MHCSVLPTLRRWNRDPMALVIFCVFVCIKADQHEHRKSLRERLLTLIFVFTRHQNVSPQNSSDVEHEDEKPHANEKDRHGTADPKDARAFELLAGSYGGDGEACVREDEGPPHFTGNGTSAIPVNAFNDSWMFSLLT